MHLTDEGITVLSVDIGERGWRIEVTGDPPKVGDNYRREQRLEERVARLEKIVDETPVEDTMEPMESE